MSGNGFSYRQANELSSLMFERTEERSGSPRSVEGAREVDNEVGQIQTGFTCKQPGSPRIDATVLDS